MADFVSRGRKPLPRLSARSSERLRELIDQACSSKSLNKLAIDEALGKPQRWTSNALNSSKGVTETDAAILYRWLLENVHLSKRDFQHIRVMSEAVRTAKLVRQAQAARHTQLGLVVPVLIDRRDVELLAAALARHLAAHLSPAPPVATLERNIKWFFNRTVPKGMFATGDQKYRDQFAFDYRATAQRRAESNGFANRAGVTLRIGGSRVKVGAGDISRMLHAIDAMTREDL